LQATYFFSLHATIADNNSVNKKLLESYIEKSRQGVSLEGSNLDFKQSWWKLSDNQGVEEFIKDICSMANTAGDCYIIVGVNEQTGEFLDSPLPMDESKLQDKLKNSVYPVIKVEFQEELIEDSGQTKKISIVRIPHSINRPYVLKSVNYKPDHIPIRLGTQTAEASRTDIDAMYSDRSNMPNLKVSLLEDKLEWGYYAVYTPAFLVRLEFDNSEGQRPEHVFKIMLVSKTAGGDRWETKHFKIEEGQRDLGVDPLFEIEGGRIRRVAVYLSEKIPQSLSYREKIPNNDSDQYRVVFKLKSGRQIPDIKIEPGWITNN
jgi:hypothetical protein